MKQTAVEWLLEHLRKSKDWQRVLNEVSQMSSAKINLLEQAKAMEKQQIIDFTDNYVDNCVIPNENMAIPTRMDVPQYYNETFIVP